MISDNVGGCTGLYGNRCPNDYTSSFDVTGASFRQGVRTNGISVEDPIGRGVSSQFTTKVDYSPPEVELKGQLARETNTEVGLGEEQPPQDQGEEGEDELSLPVYHLNIRAKDGSNASNETKQSGMRDIKLKLDGKELKVPWGEQECPQSSCEMEKNYPLQLTGLEGGVHKLVVEAIDWVDKPRLREIEFEYIPATGMKDEYVMQYFPLSDGQGNEEDEEHPVRPELAVNLMNGNLVYRQSDVDVEGPAFDLEVERFYNSQLPESENTEWGQGWTLAQTPKLEPEFEEPAPTSADMVQTSGAITNAVSLPAESGEETFDPELQATITKEPDGSYLVADESGETEETLAFDSNGKVTELLTPGYAKVDYGYEEGDLAEIAVKDPGSAGAPTEPPEGEGELEEGAKEPQEPTFVRSFGGAGSGPGHLSAPAGIAADPEGDVWVADTAHSRIQEFDSEGKFVRQFGGEGSGDGEFSAPKGLTADSEGNLWVADTGNGRLEQFSPEGAYLGQLGEAGSGEGQLSEPQGVAVGGGGDLWVADTANNRIERWSAGVAPTATSEAASEASPTAATLKGSVDPEGFATDYRFEYDTSAYGKGEAPHGTKLPASDRSAGSGEEAVAVSQRARGLEASTTYHYRLVASNAGGTVYGEDESFTTPAAGAATTEAATEVSAHGATLNATISPEGSPTGYWFEYWPKGAYPLPGGAALWYEADQIEGEDGSKVASWPDESGNERDATQAEEAEQPVLETEALNGKPVVHFDGEDDLLRDTGFKLSQPNTVFVVGKTDRQYGAFIDGTESYYSRNMIQRHYPKNGR